MVKGGPSRVSFTRHALWRTEERQLTTTTIADLVLDEHSRRQRNPGPADWVLSGKGVVVAYDWPSAGDQTLAMVVTVWQE